MSFVTLKMNNIVALFIKLDFEVIQVHLSETLHKKFELAGISNGYSGQWFYFNYGRGCFKKYYKTVGFV